MSKASKKRSCPAAGRELTPAECGDGRGSRYACPVDCPYNPFGSANYSQLLELEQTVDDQTLEVLAQNETVRSAVARAVANKDIHALHAIVSWQLFFKTDAQGQTAAQRWEQAGFPGLRNDGRVLLRAKMQTRIRLVEIHRVVDSECVEVVDLLDAEPQPFLVRDRNLAARAVRFASLLSWSYPLPHFHRFNGTAAVLEDWTVGTPVEIVTELVRHLGGPTDADGMRRWLAEHMVQFTEALIAVRNARFRRTLEQSDMNTWTADYELRYSFTVCRDELDLLPGVDPVELSRREQNDGFAEVREWLEDGSDLPGAEMMSVQVSVLGRVLLGQDRWRLSAIGHARLERLRRQFEQLMGGRLNFLSESTDNHAAGVIRDLPHYDPSLVPPQLVKEIHTMAISVSRVAVPDGGQVSPGEIAAEAEAAHDWAWLSAPVPALQGRTPREAAADPAIRPALIQLLKRRVRICDERNLKTGESYDPNWMLRELGLTEILFDPPPARPRLDETTDSPSP